jgi:penicillin G amidase
MSEALPRISFDAQGTPGIWAEGPRDAYLGLGFLHGRFRGLQTLVLGAAGRGILAERLFPKAELVRLDLLVKRLDLPGRGQAEATRLPALVSVWLDAYLSGVEQGLARAGVPMELRALCARLPALDRAAVISGMLLSAYLGLAEGQERMESALVDVLRAGANPRLLEVMFAPHLDGWEPQALAKLERVPGPGMATAGLVAGGGSNAWVVDGHRAAHGKPILCGDPHLQINQLPALLFEVRARVGDNWWLGATIPGLPGIAVGRNRHLAWSGTFACVDNVDFVIEELEDGQVRRPSGLGSVVRREVEVRRRFRRPLKVTFVETEHGVLERADGDGATLATRWPALERAADSLAAHMRLPMATSAHEAATLLESARAHSLHFLLADGSGHTWYQQLGCAPRRSDGWSGLYPVPANGSRKWTGFYEGAMLPRGAAQDGIEASANEARPAPDGAVLATLAQPGYRLERIRAMLRERPAHDRASMEEIQLDLVSIQGLALRPRLVRELAPGPLSAALARWDGRYDLENAGAHAFELAYRAATLGLKDELGGDWLRLMLEQSELSVWWCAAFDRVLLDPRSWDGDRGRRLRGALGGVAEIRAVPWGEAQQVTHGNLVLGGLPAAFGLDRGPFPLPGSRATVRQGNVLNVGGQTVAIGPAFRMIADLGVDELWTAIPGGIDGAPGSTTYDCWLRDWHGGRYHRLAPPAETELAADGPVH